MKTKLETTLKLLIKNNACQDVLRPLKASLKPNIKETDKINLLHILKSNGLNHFFWAWRATTKKEMQVKRYILADIVESVEPLFAKKYPEDLSVKNVIKYLRKGTAKQLIKVRQCIYLNINTIDKTAAMYVINAAFFAANFNCVTSTAVSFAAYSSYASILEGQQKQIKIIKKYLK